MVRLKIRRKKDIQRNNCVHSALTQLSSVTKMQNRKHNIKYQQKLHESVE